jgi:hypothetical protein
MALVERLESLTSASEFGVKLSYVLNFEFIKAMNDAMPPSNREDLSAVEARFDQMKQQQLEMMKKSVQLAFLFSYRTLTDEDLRAYVDFVKTDASQWFVKSVQDSCLSGFKKAVKQLGQKMASLISEQQSQGQ